MDKSDIQSTHYTGKANIAEDHLIALSVLGALAHHEPITNPIAGVSPTALWLGLVLRLGLALL